MDNPFIIVLIVISVKHEELKVDKKQTVPQMMELLIAAKFTEYSNPYPSTHKNANSRWQRKFHDPDGNIRYSINAFIYNEVAFQQGHEIHRIPATVEFGAILYPKKQKGEWITLLLHGSDAYKAIVFFDNAFHALDCENDRHN